MRRTWIPILMAVSLTPALLWAEPDPKAAPATVQGRALRAGTPFCGGAVPSEDAMRRIREPRPATGTPFAVQRGTANTGQRLAAEFRPGPDGTFTVSLPPGDYCVTQAARRAPAEDAGPGSRWQDAKCMKEWRRACDAIWHVQAGLTEGTFTVVDSCFGPCYTGPMPP